MGELWSGLARTLSRLDELAGEPKHLDEEVALDALRSLQYSLHTAGERIYALAPPAGAETAHAELTAALAGARDATGEVAEAIDEAGVEAAEILVHEWRGALFRVRLARLRLAPPRHRPREPETEEPRRLRRPLLAVSFALLGAAAFVAGAALGEWPLWSVGLILACVALVSYRP
jgi:hypothetical protein